ncbi:hypothetical protein [Alicyclobacillus shizuokensis]|uniref:hypothetical protein n=1 Tax=Alicyclobacillus shizuokensis TaxID=392014 RepID=UPI0008358EF8|nr:hypothetical protein [Alicyclobacillus shizuokensis]
MGKWNRRSFSNVVLMRAQAVGENPPLAQALGLALQGTSISSNLLQMLPYALTILTLAGWVGKSTPPAANGVPYNPQR